MPAQIGQLVFEGDGLRDRRRRPHRRHDERRHACGRWVRAARIRIDQFLYAPAEGRLGFALAIVRGFVARIRTHREALAGLDPPRNAFGHRRRARHAAGDPRDAVRRALIVALVAIAAACAPRRPATPAPPADSTLLVLLPDPDGRCARPRHASRADRRTVSLASEREATEAVARRPPTAPAAIDEARIQQLFGDTPSSLPPPPRAFNLYFQFDSDQLTDAARALLPEILLDWSWNVPFRTSSPSATRTPPAAARPTFSSASAARARFAICWSAPVSTRSLITVTSVGEADPLVQTADETMEPRNRRVEVSVR